MNAETPPARLAIVGLGRWGRTLVESVQDKSARVRFTGAVVRNPGSVRNYADGAGILLYQDLRTALETGEFEGVVLASPHSLHEQQALEALGAGFPVFIEKPLALDVAGACRVIQAAQQRNLVAAVGFNRRFSPAVGALNALLAEGKLGTVQLVAGYFTGNFAYRYTEDMWRSLPEESPVGGMTGLGVHLLDMMIDFVGPIHSVSTISKRRILKIDQDDTTLVNLRFADGAIGTLTTLTTTAPLFRLEVYGGDGWARVDGMNRLVHADMDGRITEEHFPASDLERLELEAFVDAINGVSAFPVTSECALAGVATLEAIVVSSKTGGWVTVETDMPS